MKEEQVINELKQALSSVRFSILEDRVIITLPFTDYTNDPISMRMKIVNDQVLFDDLGHVAGMLFLLNQHNLDSQAFGLVKNLSDDYGIKIDFDRGLLTQIIDADDLEGMVNYCKAIMSLQVTASKVKMQKPRARKGQLATKINSDFRVLHLPLKMERQIQVAGEKEIWPVNFRYYKPNESKTEVLIMTADLAQSDPRDRAASVVISAMDLKQRPNRDIRVVYEIDGIGGKEEVRRAKNLIDEYEDRLKYQIFNYASKEQKQRFLSMAHQDSTPLI